MKEGFQLIIGVGTSRDSSLVELTENPNQVQIILLVVFR